MKTVVSIFVFLIAFIVIYTVFKDFWRSFFTLIKQFTNKK